MAKTPREVPPLSASRPSREGGPTGGDPRVDLRELRLIAKYLAAVHASSADPDTLEVALRRLARRGDASPLEATAVLAAELGLATTRVRRTLAEVIGDADPSHPWLAFGSGPDGSCHALAVLERRIGGALALVPGAVPRARRWSTRALCAWLGIPDAGCALDWLIAEPAAPLSALRSAPGGPRRAASSRLRALLIRERQTLWVALVYSVVIGLLSLVVPVAVQSLVNTIAFGAVLQPLVVLTLFVLVALGFSAALNALRASVVELLQRSIFARVATDVTHRLLRVRAAAFDRYHGPELVNRFFDVVTVQKAASLLLIDGLSIAMQTLIGMLLLAIYHPWLLAFDVLLVAAMAFIVFALGRGALRTAIQESKAKYALEAWLEQIAAQLVTFKSDGGAAFAERRAHTLLERYLEYRSAHFSILLRQIIGSFALQAAASAALLGIGGWLVIERQLTLGQLVASELIVTAMVSAFTKFGKQLEVFYDLSAALDKLGDLIDLPLERRGGEGAPPPSGPARLSLRGVEVHWDSEHPPALRIAALDVEPGARLGIHGPTGSGKSTLADLLYGLREPSAGAVVIDGVDLRQIPLETLRRQVALVRGVELFSGTILDNVRLGREELSLEEVCEALAAVGLLAELRALPAGLDTALQPHGRPLSQRQAGRLMLARALVGRPRLLIVDGSLDPMDFEPERDPLLAALFSPAAPWTLICVTQRSEPLAHCDRVLELREGEIAAPGAQESLAS